MVALRGYQLHDVDAVLQSYATGHTAPLLVAPTGSGKTITFVEITRRTVLAGSTALIAVPKREIVLQTSRKLVDAGVAHGIVAAGLDRDHDAPVVVASVMTAIRRRLPKVGMLVLDEAHHAVAKSWKRLIAAHPDAQVLGVTATPLRLDGKGLGKHAGGVFDDLLLSASIKDLTEVGYLVPARVFAAVTKLDLSGVHTIAGDFAHDGLARAVMAANLAGDAVGEYRRRADHQPAVAFGVTVEHAGEIATAFRDAGYRAAVVHGGMAMAERDALVAGLGNGNIEVLCSCDILGEGVDIPNIACAMLLRPTKSLALHLQQIGRGLRPAPGKDHLTVLDIAGNSLTHGLPDAVHHWSLDGAPKPVKLPWLCECGALNQAEALRCIACGALRYPASPPPGPRIAPIIDARVPLVEITQQDVALLRFQRLMRMPYRQFQQAWRTREEVEAYGRRHGYKPGWVFYTTRAREDAA